MKTITWIIGDQLERNIWFHRPHLSGGSGLVRFKWISDYVNAHPELGLRYKAYRPWKKTDGVIFQKSMGPRSLELLRRMKNRGGLSVFDANVNYYESWGPEYYEGMMPTPEQAGNAHAMTTEADAVIGDSSYLADLGRTLNSRVEWIPDNVPMELVPEYYRTTPEANGRLRLLWSGQALKLFELLAIEEVLREFAGQVELVLITNSMDALDRWHNDLKRRFERMLSGIHYRVVEYTTIEALFDVYAQGGVFISPRFMDNSYNMGHSEWKIALAMACGRMVLCSPVPSYRDVAERANGLGIRVCDSVDEWCRELASVIAGDLDLEAEETEARRTIARHYSTESVARRHADFVNSLMPGQAAAV